MKKIIGILFAIIGLWMLLAGIVAITNATTISHTPGGRFFSTFSSSYHNDIQLQQIIGLVFSMVGLTFTIIGIVMLAGKSKLQINKERELAEFKKNSSTPPKFNPIKTTNTQQVVNEDKYLLIEKLAKLKDQSVLTEEEFLEEKRKILNHI